MGWFVKIFFGLLGIAVIGGFVINRMPDFKRRVVEIINPAAKEGRLLGELNTILDGLGGNTDPAKSKDLVDKARGIASELTSHNQKNSGIIKQQVGKIVDALLDRTPYPADHLQASPNTSVSPLVCPPVKN